MVTAAHVMALGKNWPRQTIGPARGASLPGVPFLPGIMPDGSRIIVEWAPGADLTASQDTWPWQDITGYLMHEDDSTGITISPVGRSDEYSQAQPANCGFSLDNTLGLFSKGPQSPNFPNVKRDVPIRVRLSLGAGVFDRFRGLADGFTPVWDITAQKATVVVSASGRTRSIGRKSTVLQSAITRSVLAKANTYGLYQYWSCEDESGAAVLASNLPGGPSMTFVEFVGNPIPAGLDPNGLANSEGLLQPPAFGGWGTNPLPQLNTGGAFTASFPAGNASGWTVQIAIWTDLAEDIDSTSLTRTLAEWYTPNGTFVKWQLIMDYVPATNGTRIVAYRADGTTSTCNAAGWTFFNLNELVASAQQVGPDIVVNATFSKSITATATFAGSTLSGVNGFTANPLRQQTNSGTSPPPHNFSVGQVRIWNQANVPTFQQNVVVAPSAWNGYSNEMADARFARLCTENNLTYSWAGSAQCAMGCQLPDTLINLLRECETADQAIMLDGLFGVDLFMVWMNYRVNAPPVLTLDVPSGHLASVLAPVDDDQRNRNLVVASRKNGGSATWEDTTSSQGTGPGGIDVYDEQITFNHPDETNLLGLAQWLVHVGTDPSPYRYPEFDIDFAANAGVASLAQAWLQNYIGGRVDVTNPDQVATQHPSGTIRNALEGYSESLSPSWWFVNGVFAPQAPWRVIQIAADTGDTGEYVTHIDADSGDVTIAGNPAKGVTSLTVNVNVLGSGLSITTNADDAPFDINVGGWQVTVASVAAVSGGQQVLTTNATPAQFANGTPVTMWNPPVLAF